VSVHSETPEFLVNGRSDDCVDVRDRGFMLGDGLFETIAVRNGTPRFWQAHMDRLVDGAMRLGLPAPVPGTLADEAERVVAGRDGTLRITWTRGPGPRGYAVRGEPTPSRVLAFYPGRPAPRPRPLRLRWCTTRLAIQPLLAGLKHLNRLEQVLARAEWTDDAIDEGIVCAHDGRVVECVAANLFLVRDGTVMTPDLSECGVAGVVRREVLVVARGLGHETRIVRIEATDVESADEVFVTNATLGVAAVGQVGARTLDAPGPVTARLARAIEERE